jgi:hypothetical protein
MTSYLVTAISLFAFPDAYAVGSIKAATLILSHLIAR